MTEDLPRSRPRRTRRLTLLATGLVSLGLWTGVAGASDGTEANTGSAVAVDLPGWNGETVEGDAARLVARIGQAMDASVGVDDTGNRWSGVGGVGNRWSGTPRSAGWGNRWVGR